MCDVKQWYTQHGGMRPFDVSFLFASWDAEHGFQLYHSDPSGNYGGWRATAIGANSQAGNSMLKSELQDEDDEDDSDDEEGEEEAAGGGGAGGGGGGGDDAQKKEASKPKLTVREALKLAVKVLAKTMDTTMFVPEKMEFSTLTLESAAAGGEVVHHLLSSAEATALLAEVEADNAAEGDA